MAFKTWLHFSDDGSKVGTHHPYIEFIIQGLFFSTVFFPSFFLGLLHEHHTDVNKVTAVQSLYF